MTHQHESAAPAGTDSSSARAIAGAAAGRDQELILTPDAWAHGGHTVARTESGRVVFVRHTDVGETVRVRLTEAGAQARFWRGDAFEVLEPAPARRDHHPWAAADAVRAAAYGHQPVGGAELGHLELVRQREIKTRVLRELLGGIGGFPEAEVQVLDPVVRALPGEHHQGLGWRTRAHFAVNDDGGIAMHPHRSEDLVPVLDFPLMVPALEALDLAALDLTGVQRVDLAVPATGPDSAAPLILLTAGSAASISLAEQLTETLDAHLTRLNSRASVVLAPADGAPGPPRVLRGRDWLEETAGSFRWKVSAGGFWQIHRQAPDTLLTAVLDSARAQPGQNVLDLYSGAGLFTAGLAEAVGTTGTVTAVEGSPVSTADARANFAATQQVEVLRGSVDKVLARRWPDRVRPALTGRGHRRRGRRAMPAGELTTVVRPDVVVLDPPRAGAGKAVVDAIHALGPRRVVYVSCDPATLARDLARFRHHGFTVESVQGLDLYPNTHHLETVVTLTG